MNKSHLVSWIALLAVAMIALGTIIVVGNQTKADIIQQSEGSIPSKPFLRSTVTPPAPTTTIDSVTP